MTPAQIVRLAEASGFELRRAGDGKVQIRPEGAPADLRAAIAASRTGVVEILRLREAYGPDVLDRIERAQTLFPSLLRTATLHGTQVALWGVSPYGVTVAQNFGGPLLIADPAELILDGPQ